MTTNHEFGVASRKVLFKSKFHDALLAQVAEGGMETGNSISTHPLFHEVREILSRDCLDGLHQLLVCVCVCVDGG